MDTLQMPIDNDGIGRAQRAGERGRDAEAGDGERLGQSLA
jgi:hypothetical protein